MVREVRHMMGSLKKENEQVLESRLIGAISSMLLKSTLDNG